MKWLGWCLVALMIVVAVVTTRRTNVRNEILARWMADFAAVQGQLARSELLVEQYRQDKAFLESQILALELRPAKVQTVYRCAEKRPVPAFEPEWHHGSVTTLPPTYQEDSVEYVTVNGQVLPITVSRVLR